jgi:GNAT superfamily N-acetyltransferase
MALFREQADVSVRPAVAGDEHAIADIQLAAWRTSHTEVLGAEVIADLDHDAFAAGWQAAIATPPGPGHRVLVACDGPRVVGFVALRPLGESAGEIVALEVWPAAQKGGHGSRLLAAAVDLLREDGVVQIGTWVLEGDAAREQFLGAAGLGPDGVERALATGVREIIEHRWVAAL